MKKANIKKGYVEVRVRSSMRDLDGYLFIDRMMRLENWRRMVEYLLTHSEPKKQK